MGWHFCRTDRKEGDCFSQQLLGNAIGKHGRPFDPNVQDVSSCTTKNWNVPKALFEGLFAPWAKEPLIQTRGLPDGELSKLFVFNDI